MLYAENAIERAEQKLSQTKEGDKEGEFSTEVRKKLQIAIKETQSVLQTPITQSDIIEATQILTSATNDYISQRNLPFVVGEKYYIMHASNRFLANVNNSVQIKNRDNSTAQQFIFEEASNGTYSIKNVQSGQNLLLYRLDLLHILGIFFPSLFHLNQESFLDELIF